MPVESPPLARPDHRVEVARRRREMMQARILHATMKVCSANPTTIPTIDDIIQAAEISRGAFYRYFTSSTEAIEELGVSLVNELADAILIMYDTLTDPLQRACVGTLLVMERAAYDVEWASFILRADLTIHKSRITAFIEHDIHKGHDAGYFTIGNVEWTAEFIMGINLAAIRGMMVRTTAEKKRYYHEAVRFVLRSLGVVHDEVVAHVMKWGNEYLAKNRNGIKWWENNKITSVADTARKPQGKKR